jgi:hypothetical protein
MSQGRAARHPLPHAPEPDPARARAFSDSFPLPDGRRPPVSGTPGGRLTVAEPAVYTTSPSDRILNWSSLRSDRRSDPADRRA